MGRKISAFLMVLAAVIAAVGGLALAFAARLVQTIDAAPDAPIPAAQGQTSAAYQAQVEQYRKNNEDWTHRNRWYELAEDAGRTMIAAGLPLGLVALALSRGTQPPALQPPTAPPPVAARPASLSILPKRSGKP